MIISTDICERQQELEAFLLEHIGSAEVYEPVVNDNHRWGKIPDDELIQRIKRSKQSDKFKRLYSGDTTGYSSQSEADQALCNILAFWTDKNPDQMDRIFRESDLIRSKWDEKRGEQTYGEVTIEKAILGCPDVQVSDSDEAGEWEAPVSLDQPDLPKFDQHDFPPILWRMIEAVSMATETPVELPGLIALSVAATAVQKRMKIEPEPGYLEPLNIWTCSILPPGARKSAVLTSLEKPLHKWERDQANLLEPIIQKATSKREVEEQRLKDLQRRYAKEEDATKRDVQLQEIEQLSVGLPEIPALPRLTAQDVTPEHLGVLLAENGERMGIFSAEGGIFGNIGGRYSNGVANLDLFLQSYSGDVVRVDRGSRPPVLLNNPALSMGLTVQPDVVKSLTKRREFRGQGLLARFQFALPENNIGRRTLITVPIPEEVEQVYSQIISRLLNWPVTDEAPAIKLCPEALSVWKQFQRSVEDGMAAGGLFEHMQEYAGKLPGAAARIAGIFHCVEYIHALAFPAIDDAGDLIDSTVLDLPSQPHMLPLSVDTMRRAVSLATKLSRHALCVYDLMEADEHVQVARRILQWVRRTGIETFTARECHSALKGSYPKRDNINPGFNVLIERGYIRRVDQRAGKVGRPSESFEITPLIHR